MEHILPWSSVLHRFCASALSCSLDVGRCHRGHGTIEENDEDHRYVHYKRRRLFPNVPKYGLVGLCVPFRMRFAPTCHC